MEFGPEGEGTPASTHPSALWVWSGRGFGLFEEFSGVAGRDVHCRVHLTRARQGTVLQEASTLMTAPEPAGPILLS